MNKIKIGIIAAINTSGIYAVELTSSISPRGNGIPWDISEDFKNFKKVTLGNGENKNSIIMGFATKETITFLKGRINIVVTSKEEDKFNDGTIFCKSIIEAIEKSKEENPNLEEIWLIGGKRIWDEGLEIADEVRLTVVEKDIPENEKVFVCESLIPENLEKDFSITQIEEKTTEEGLNYKFITFKK